MTDNLAIWQKVETTDPKYTKPITGRGYNGTSTNATYLVKKATSVFGPCGIGWGVTVLNEGLLDGADGAKVHRVHIRLWYILDGKRGEVEHFGQTDFCGKRKSGQWFTDEEAPKKSMTDAMLKALSMIGFAADIHLGQYDDNKYVATLKRDGVDEPWQTAGEEYEAPGEPPPPGEVHPQTRYAKHVKEGLSQVPSKIKPAGWADAVAIIDSATDFSDLQYKTKLPHFVNTTSAWSNYWLLKISLDHYLPKVAEFRDLETAQEMEKKVRAKYPLERMPEAAE